MRRLCATILKLSSKFDPVTMEEEFAQEKESWTRKHSLRLEKHWQEREIKIIKVTFKNKFFCSYQFQHKPVLLESWLIVIQYDSVCYTDL